MEALTEALKVIHEGSLKNDRELLKLIEAVIEKLDKLERRVNSLDRDELKPNANFKQVKDWVKD